MKMETNAQTLNLSIAHTIYIHSTETFYSCHHSFLFTLDFFRADFRRNQEAFPKCDTSQASLLAYRRSGLESCTFRATAIPLHRACFTGFHR